MQTGIFIVFEGGDVKKTWISQRGAVRYIITINATFWNTTTVACRTTLTHNSEASEIIAREAALETQKKMPSALGLHIWSQQKHTVTRAWDNLFEGFLWKLRVVTVRHGNIYHQSSTRTGTDPWREWLTEIFCNFGPYGETFLERAARGKLLPWLPEARFNLILSSVTEN